MSATYFTFVGAKGGVGTSTIVSEIAKALRERHPITVVDGDLTARRTLGILFEAVRALDLAHEEQGDIASARTSGVTILELTRRYESAFAITGEDVGRAAARCDNGIVLVDAPLPLNSTVRPFVERSTRFCVVIEPTVLGVAAARTLIAEMKNFGISADRICGIVCNRVTRPFSASDVEKAVATRIVATIPDSSERGYAKSVSALAASLAAEPARAPLTALRASDNGRTRDRRAAPAAKTGALDFIPIARARDADYSATDAIKAQVHDVLAKHVDLLDASKVQGDAAKLADMRGRISDIAEGILREHAGSQSAETVAQLKQEVVNEALGLGPLEPLMHDPLITEIMVNGPDTIYVERHGKIEKTQRRFADARQLQLVIERIIAPLGRRLDESSPMVDARLPDGSRVNAIVHPLSLDGSTLTIRRFGARRLTDRDLLVNGSATPELMDFMRACVEARLNVVVSGGTGSGKTTFLNILSSYLPPDERIVTIEDAAELCLNQPHVVRLESRPPNLEGTGQVTIRDLVRNALRMRPDRIVIGECRGAEALDMLQAMNTGHDGSITTVHANSPRDALARVETMVLMSGFDLPVRAIREQISSAVDIVIQTARLRDGSRKVTSVSEVVGMEGDIVTMQEIMRFVQSGVDDNDRVRGTFESTGVQPFALKAFRESGVHFDTLALALPQKVANLW